MCESQTWSTVSNFLTVWERGGGIMIMGVVSCETSGLHLHHTKIWSQCVLDYLWTMTLQSDPITNVFILECGKHPNTGHILMPSVKTVIGIWHLRRTSELKISNILTHQPIIQNITCCDLNVLPPLDKCLEYELFLRGLHLFLLFKWSLTCTVWNAAFLCTELFSALKVFSG